MFTLDKVEKFVKANAKTPEEVNSLLDTLYGIRQENFYKSRRVEDLENIIRMKDKVCSCSKRI